MKIRNLGEATILFYAAITYVPQFFFHLLDEPVMSGHYRIGESTQGYAIFIPIFFLLVIALNRLLPRFSDAPLKLLALAHPIFTSRTLQLGVGFTALALAINFFLTQGIGFRQTHRMAESGIWIGLLFALKPYIYIWMLYHFFEILHTDQPRPSTRFVSLLFLAALALSVTSSLNMVFVFWMALLALLPHRLIQRLFLSPQGQSHFDIAKLASTLIIRPVLGILIVLAIVSIGFFNKFGIDGTFVRINALGIWGIVEELLIRLSASYASTISFVSYNLFNFEIYQTAFSVPFDSILYRLSVLFSASDLASRPEITQISRLNYLEYIRRDLFGTLPNAGASPGLVGSAFFAGPFPLGFLIIGLYTVMVIRLINLAQRALQNLPKPLMVLFMTAMTFTLFESPLDYLIIIDPSFLYIALYITALASIYSRHQSNNVNQP